MNAPVPPPPLPPLPLAFFRCPRNGFDPAPVPVPVPAVFAVVAAVVVVVVALCPAADPTGGGMMVVVDLREKGAVDDEGKASECVTAQSVFFFFLCVCKKRAPVWTQKLPSQQKMLNRTEIIGTKLKHSQHTHTITHNTTQHVASLSSSDRKEKDKGNGRG